MDGLLTFIIFVTLLSYCEPWFFDGVLDHGNVQRCPQSIPRDNFLYALNDTCIQLIREEHSWNDARQYCTQHHGDLVVIQDMTKQQFIMNALKTSGWVKNGIWIGGTDREREGHWKWVNGHKMTWGNWERGQGPGNRGFLFSGGQFEDCAVIRRDDGYKWHDYPCNSYVPQYHYSSICEYNFIPTTTHRPTTQTLPTPAPTTQSSTTPSPMSQSTTTPAPTTQSSTTPAPMTQSTTTSAPTTQLSTTPAPTTQSTTTPAPTTQTSTTPAPTTQSTTTPAPTTQTSTTPAPTTQSSTTPAPTTQSSTTPAPTTKSTTTPAPTTQSSTTPAPTTQTTTKPAPTTRSSTKPVLSTQIPTSKLPTTQPLATTLATTQKSTTPVPTTQISTTTIPTTKSTKPPAQTINLVTTSRTPLKTQILRTTKAKSTLFSTPIPTMKVTKAAPTTTQEIKETTTSPENPLPTQLVNNQGGLLRRSDNGNKPTNKSSTGYIIGGVCVAVVVAGIIVAVIVVRRRRISSNDANRKVHAAENPMYSVMYDDTSVPPVGAEIQINDMYEPTKYFTNGESMS